MPVPVPASVEITEKGQMLTVKGPKGSLEHTIHEMVELKREDAERARKLLDDAGREQQS